MNTIVKSKQVVNDKTTLSKPTRSGAQSARLNSAQRNTVRVVLATGATMAALIGAQTLAILDRSVDVAQAAAPLVVTATPVMPLGIANQGKPTIAPTATTIPSSAKLKTSTPVIQTAPIQPSPTTWSTRHK